jgi:CO dehydrogenase maturation factor
MKLAISGKGGVGKTLLAALLSKIFAESGYSVIAIDADPDANLAATLGFPDPESITPVSEMKDLIQERTGARPGQAAPYFTLNPKVDDIPEKYARRLDGIRLMRMGSVKGGGSGCYCPESALLKTLMAHLLVGRDEAVILDMEAGIEHLTRGTSGAVDRLIVVVEPGRRSIETAQSIQKLATDLGIKNLAAVGNKVRGESDRRFLKAALPDIEFVGFIPYDQAVTDADLGNRSVLTSSPQVLEAARGIYQALVSAKKSPDTK